MRDFREQNYYELLDLAPHASQQELETAYQRARRIFSPDSVVTYTLFQPEELSLLRRRIEEAYRTLSNPERRKRYDEEMDRLDGGHWEEGGGDAPGAPAQPEPPAAAGDIEGLPLFERPASKPPALDAPAALDAPPAVEAPAAPDAPPTEALPASQPPAVAEPPAAGPPAGQCLPPMPSLDEHTVYEGQLLRQVREARGLSLEHLAQLTKINLFYLRRLEENDLDQLPAPVYVRGYLRQIARLLRLDAELLLAGFDALRARKG